MTLETLLTEAAQRGDLGAVTLWRIPDGRYQANWSRDRISWRVDYDADPAVALAKVLSGPGNAYDHVGTAPVPPQTDAGSLFD